MRANNNYDYGQLVAILSIGSTVTDIYLGNVFLLYIYYVCSISIMCAYCMLSVCVYVCMY